MTSNNPTKREKLKCLKCAIYFRDRKDENDSPTEAKLCMDCLFIWLVIYTTLMLFPDKLNRYTSISLDSIKIKKLPKNHQRFPHA